LKKLDDPIREHILRQSESLESIFSSFQVS